MHILDTYLESEIDLFAARLAKLNINKESLVDRFVVRKDRTTFYAQIELSILDNGWTKGIIHNASLPKDVTSHIEDNEEKFRQITEHIREVFFLVDLNTGQLLYISPGYEAIWQKSVRSLLTKPESWMSIIHPEDKKSVLKLFKQQQKTGFIDAKFSYYSSR